jgi:hypothetical protein
VELRPLAGGGVHPAVVHAGTSDLDLPGPCGKLPRWGVAVAAHQPVAALVARLGTGGDVGVNLGFQRNRQHPAGTLAEQFVQVQRELGSCLLVSNYTQHVAAFLPRRLTGRRPSVWSRWKVRRVLMPGAHPQFSTISRCTATRR